VVLDKATYDRIIKDVPTFRFISPAILIERLKINGSLARIAIRHLEKEGAIKRIVHHNGQLIYSAYYLFAWCCITMLITWIYSTSNCCNRLILDCCSRGDLWHLSLSLASWCRLVHVDNEIIFVADHYRHLRSVELPSEPIHFDCCEAPETASTVNPGVF
jgi:S25 ribosomal protein